MHKVGLAGGGIGEKANQTVAARLEPRREKCGRPARESGNAADGFAGRRSGGAKVRICSAPAVWRGESAPYHQQTTAFRAFLLMHVDPACCDS